MKIIFRHDTSTQVAIPTASTISNRKPNIKYSVIDESDEKDFIGNF